MNIEIKNLTKRYGKNVAVNNLSLKIPAGNIYGFIGSNGAGKTTTMKMLVGLLKKDEGKVFFDGREVSFLDEKLAKKIGVFISKPNYYPNLTAYENLIYLQKITNQPEEEVDRVLKLVHLDSDKHKRVSDFSLGMKQRLGLAIAFLNNPDVYILDEPTNGLDPQGVYEIRQLLFQLSHDEGKTIFISSHNLAELERISDRICILDKGNKLFEGTIEELYAKKGAEYCLITDQTEKTEQVLLENGIYYEKNNNMYIFESKKDKIPVLINALVKQSINIFEVSPNNSLESIYLSLARKKDGE